MIDELERSLGLGESALTYLKTHRTPAYPRNYELWYTYAAGFNRELNKAINDSLKKGGGIDAALTDRLYDEFLSPIRLGDRVGEVSNRVSGELSDIIELLESSGGSVRDYGETLRSAIAGLNKVDSTGKATEIVMRVIDATAEMQSRNSDLETRLNESHTQIREIQESLETIRYESLTDQLSGLANRKHFDQSLERTMVAARRRGEPLSLVMCDIDHFKEFNDTYGHQTGDQVLRLVGSAIRNSVKGRDIAARYGGEEFAVILPDTDIDSAVMVANQIRTAVMAKELIKRSTGESLGRITMSFGVAGFTPEDTVETLIDRADASLYRAKHNGRNRVADERDPEIGPRNFNVA